MELAQNEKAFDANWINRRESGYLHWTDKQPANQIQFAFRNHWLTFSRFLPSTHGRSLEIGCGRGSLSAYFAEASWKCTLLDISETVLKKAQSSFEALGFRDSQFVTGDCTSLPFEDDSFDVTFSIGLLEHLHDDQLHKCLSEQFRCLNKNGKLFAYIVPEKRVEVQKPYQLMNDLLSFEHRPAEPSEAPKQRVYRASHSLDFYTKQIKDFNAKIELASGIYSVPMISHSCEFPFTLLSDQSEQYIVKHLQEIMQSYKESDQHDPWLCTEDYGHALLVVATKL